MNPAKLHITTMQDLARSVRGECGEYVCSEVAYVVATAPNGRRWRHPDEFMVVEILCDDDFPWAWPNKKAEDELEAKLAEVQAQQATGTLSIDDWGEIDPVYGSEAWGPEDEWRLAMEERDAYS